MIISQQDIQIFRSIVLGEEELGQNAPQTMCFITRFIKNEFITSDAMSKLRQVNAVVAGGGGRGWWGSRG